MTITVEVDSTTQVLDLFIGLVKAKPRLDTRAEEPIILGALDLAGFKVRSLKKRPQKQAVRDGYGDYQGEAITNEHSGYVVETDPGDDRATIWLNRLWGQLDRSLTKAGGSQARIQEEMRLIVKTIIDASRPFLPIQLNNFGEKMDELLHPTDVFDKRQRDADSIERQLSANGEGRIGRHLLCKGVMTYAVVSNSHAAINCPKCNLRLVVPTSVKTFGQLRAFLNPGPKSETQDDEDWPRNSLGA